MKKRSVDVVVIGAGIIGLNCAFQLARRSGLSILVLEMASMLGTGSTGASSAVCRHRYSLDETLILARDGIAAYRNWSDYLGESAPIARFHQDGVLWLTPEGSGWSNDEVLRLKNLKVAAELLSPDDIRHRFPAINPCAVAPDTLAGQAHDCEDGTPALFEMEGGYFDPVYALQDLAAAVARHKVEIKFKQKVARILTGAGRATGIELLDGELIHTGIVINATGPWCNDILTELGFAAKWALKPTRIQMVHLDRSAVVKGDIPVCCDIAGGIYFRTQNLGQQIVLGSTREEDEHETIAPDLLPAYIDDSFRDSCLHALHHRIPSLPYTGAVRGYCGLYTVNHIDVHPVVGESPLSGFYVANGFSGHGFKLAPAIGSLVAQQITGITTDFDTDVSADFLAFDRAPLQLASKNVLA